MAAGAATAAAGGADGHCRKVSDRWIIAVGQLRGGEFIGAERLPHTREGQLIMKPDDAAARPFFGAPEPLPPYTYIPGRHPHPINDPDGHSYDQEDDLDPTMPLNASHPLFRRGVDLFNHGYYWEAHEAWESLWIMAGRCGMLADLLKALIKLAAAGVKCLERRPLGTQRHAARAAELLCNLPPGPTLGLDLNEFQGQVRWTRKHAAELTPSEGREVKPIFPFVLTIHDDCSAA